MVPPLRIRLLSLIDRAAVLLLATVILGTALAFGGAVWWARPAIGVLLALLGAAMLARAPLLGAWRMLRSPLALLWAALLGLAVVQMTPLPARLAARLSPRAQEANSLGVLVELARLDDPGLEWTEAASGRCAASLDRSATLRWLVGGLACLVVFCATSHVVDRLGRTLAVWGAVIAAFLVNAAFALVQVVNRSSGLYGSIVPGRGNPWGPSLADAMRAPGASALRLAADPSAGGTPWAIARPEEGFLLGSLPGGPGAFLALASLALPLTLGALLHALAPRGSRESLRSRLNGSGAIGIVALLLTLTVIGAALVGMLSGRRWCLPFAVGIALAGLPSAQSTGLRWTAVLLTLAALAGLAAGVRIGEHRGDLAEVSQIADPSDWGRARRTWSDSARILGDFPVLGTGLGSFDSVYPMYKSSDLSPNTARSSLLQFAVESGLVGIGLLAIGSLWCLARWPGALRRVGTADRALAHGLIGATACFLSFSAIHWTVELAAIAIAASAVGGTMNRWLAGGTDLFVEPA